MDEISERIKEKLPARSPLYELQRPQVPGMGLDPGRDRNPRPVRPLAIHPEPG